MPWGDSGIYGGCCTGLKPRVFAQNCRERGRFVKLMIIKATSQFPRLLLVIIISENDDHKKSQNSQHHGFLWSSYVLYKDDHKKSWRLNGGFFWSSFSKIVPPFPCNFEQKFSVWDLYSIPIYARITPRALVKKVIIGYLKWITNNPPDLISYKSFSWACLSCQPGLSSKWAKLWSVG